MHPDLLSNMVNLEHATRISRASVAVHADQVESGRRPTGGLARLLTFPMKRRAAATRAASASSRLAVR